MAFNPNSKKYPYPEYTDQHYLAIKMDCGIIFDEHYPYVDKSKGFQRKVFWVRVLLHLIVFPMTIIKMGLKVKNRKVLKKYKDLLDKGMITISNHVHLYDYLAVTYALRNRRPHVLVWNKNVNDKSGPLVRLVGGIPIPEHNMKATYKYLNDISSLLNEGGFLHIYPEGSMWEYYQMIRPFKMGAFHLAKKYNKAILPMAFSYKKANFIRRKLFHQPATYVLRIGEPILPSEYKDEKALLIKAHQEVVKLANIHSQENVYEPIFNHSKRIDY